MEIVIASHNLHKIREIREMLKQFKHIDLLSLLNFPQYVPPEENGKTFQENALLKAKAAVQALQKCVIADDSGLVVPSLNGAPGVNSRRYSGEDATDAENRQKLLQSLAEKQDHERSAYFECCLVIAKPEGFIKSVSAICEGEILREEKGRNGFGYDPLFVKSEYDKTFAELDETVKHRISHRGKALQKLYSIIETMST